MIQRKIFYNHMIVAAVIFAAVFAVFGKTLSFELLSNWDDAKYVTQNNMVKGLSIKNLWDAFTSVIMGNYAPLHMISYMLDYEIWGDSPFGYHLSNLLLHAANGFLMYILLLRLSWRKIHALAASLLFIVHPVQVESVAWVSERKNLLALFFFFLAFIFYTSYRTASRRHRRLAYAGSLLALTLSLLSKSVSVVFPLIIVAYDACFHSRGTNWRWRDKIPFFALSVAFSIVTVLTQSVELEGGRTGYHGGGPLATFFTMLPVFVRYMWMVVWPSGLSPIYNPPVRVTPDMVVVASAVFLSAVMAAAYFFYRRRSECFFWIIFFFVPLLPVSQIVPLLTLMNDRYLYFPLVGAACLAVIGISRICAKFKLAQAESAILAALIVAYGYAAFVATTPWKNAIILWENAIRRTPDVEGTWTGLGEAYQTAGRTDEALEAYLKALALEPANPLVMNNIAVIYAEKGDRLKSRSYLIRLLKAKPWDVNALVNLGNNYVLSGRYDLAVPTYIKALKIEPENGKILMNLGNVYLNMHDFVRSEESYRRSLEVSGETAELLYNWSALESLKGNSEMAMKRLERALQLGYRDFDYLMKDPAMEPLKKQPHFHELLVRYFRENR